MGWWDIVCEWHNANEAKFNFQFSLPSITMNDFPYFSHINFSMPASTLWPFFSLFHFSYVSIFFCHYWCHCYYFLNSTVFHWLTEKDKFSMLALILLETRKYNSEIFQIMNDSAVEYKRVRAVERSWILKDNSDFIPILIIITVCSFSQGSHYA